MKYKPEDLKIDIFRPPGIGDVTRCETAVRITHKPTGIVVLSTKERSHKENMNKALKELEEKLDAL